MVERVALVSTEALGYAAVGGLAPYTTGLAKALRAKGLDVRILCPRYCPPRYREPPENPDMLNEELIKRAKKLADGLAETEVAEIPLYLVAGSVQQYGYTGESSVSALSDYASDEKSACAFGDAILFTSSIPGALEKIKEQGEWTPDIAHLNDWPTAYAAPLLRSKETPVLYMIHNGQYIGRIPPKHVVSEIRNRPFSVAAPLRYAEERLLSAVSPCIRIDDDVYLSLSEVGIDYANTVGTVGTSYAQEMVEPGRPGSLDERSIRLLMQKGGAAAIPNGIDGVVLNPKTDELIPMQYDPADILFVASGKHANKHHLQKEFGLPSDDGYCVISMIGRLTSQKGIWEVCKALDDLASMKKLQLIVAGQADNYELKERIKNVYNPWKAGRPSIRVVDEYVGPRLHHLILAGSDFILMPSRYEPCGQAQMEGMAYGAIPIVNPTGGLKDTVQQFDGVRGNGILMKDLSKDSLMEAIQRAQTIYRNKRARTRAISNALASDFRWDRPNDPSVDRYIALYEQAIASKRS